MREHRRKQREEQGGRGGLRPASQLEGKQVDCRSRDPEERQHADPGGGQARLIIARVQDFVALLIGPG